MIFGFNLMMRTSRYGLPDLGCRFTLIGRSQGTPWHIRSGFVVVSANENEVFMQVVSSLFFKTIVERVEDGGFNARNIDGNMVYLYSTPHDAAEYELELLSNEQQHVHVQPPHNEIRVVAEFDLSNGYIEDGSFVCHSLNGTLRFGVEECDEQGHFAITCPNATLRGVAPVQR
jgi:hypothetical protein